MTFLSVDEYREAARDRLPGMAFDYYAGGSREESTLRENREAFDRIRLRHRVLRDVSGVDPAVEILGHRLSLPVLVAPTAFHGLTHDRGEVATARGAAEAGTVMTLSTLSNRPMEEVAAAAGGDAWFQLYVYRDREATAELVRRAEDAGFSAVVLTVDAPVLGTRERDVRNRFHLPEGLSLANLPKDMEDVPREEAESGLAAYVASNIDPSIDWDDLSWLVDLTRLPVLVKGVVHPDDARRALDRGAAGVVVSNHGGRQLDGGVATLDALPDVAAAVEGRGPVLVDGGVRRGTGVVKALARGADAVAVGRPVLWALAVGGPEGVAEVLTLLRDELAEALALCGCRSPGEVTGDLLVDRARGSG